MDSHQFAPHPKWSRIIGITSFIIIITAVSWLLWSGHSDIRYTADHNGTIPIWNKWAPALVSILLIHLIPFRLVGFNPLFGLSQRLIIIQSWVFILGAVFFTTTLLLVMNKGLEFHLWFIGLKLGFLLFIPWMLLRIIPSYQTKRSTPAPSHLFSRWNWLGPLIIMSVWVYLNYFSVFASTNFSSNITDPATLIVTLLSGFLINSLLEEIFYRVWLQTRLEMLLGTWPAILLTSILWASWHIAIQSTGRLNVDIATVIANQGVTGLFLGYLWARYRNVWSLIIIHGLINASPCLLYELLNIKYFTP